MNSDKYNLEWFKQRAIASLKKIDDQSWDYSDSLLLYSEGTEEEYVTIQKEENDYYKLITKPEQDFFNTVASHIAKRLPEVFDYIDLGPGTEHKEQSIFDELKKQNKRLTYIPVDINQRYLDLAQDHAAKQDIATKPIRASFEELAILLGSVKRPRFVSLGLTYTNYHSAEILTMLKNFAGEGGFIFVDQQMRERADMVKISALYNRDVYALAEPKLRLLGLNPKNDISEHQSDSGIRVWSVVKNPTNQMQKLGITPGSKLLVFQSLRRTLHEFQEDISVEFRSYELIDAQYPFVGVILRT